MPPYNMEHSQSFYDGGSSCSGPSSSSSSLHQSSLPNVKSSTRPLHHKLYKSTSNIETRDGLLHLAALELEAMRFPSTNSQSSSATTHCNSQRTLSPQSPASSCSSNNNQASQEIERSFPPACLHLLQSLPQNTKCHDCHSPSSPATWASVSYGITLCLQCSGKHRSLGVQCSFIKSLTLDSWKRREILCMLEGGNEQLSGFFERHEMGGGRSGPRANAAVEQKGLEDCDSAAIGNVGVLDRYKTKAASFYRQHLLSHAKCIAGREGLYEGREASRANNNKKSLSSSGKKQSSKSGGSGGGSHKKKEKKSLKQAKKLPTVTEKED